jgi:hypothetical protein
VDILRDPIVQETVCISKDHIDVVVCPAEGYTSTVEEEDTNNVTGTV